MHGSGRPVQHGTVTFVPYRYDTVQYLIPVPICKERIIEAKGNSLEYFLIEGMPVDNIALHFHCENMLYCSQPNISCRDRGEGAINTLLLVPLRPLFLKIFFSTGSRTVKSSPH